MSNSKQAEAHDEIEYRDFRDGYIDVLTKFVQERKELSLEDELLTAGYLWDDKTPAKNPDGSTNLSTRRITIKGREALADWLLWKSRRRLENAVKWSAIIVACATVVSAICSIASCCQCHDPRNMAPTTLVAKQPSTHPAANNTTSQSHQVTNPKTRKEKPNEKSKHH